MKQILMARMKRGWKEYQKDGQGTVMSHQGDQATNMVRGPLLSKQIPGQVAKTARRMKMYQKAGKYY